MSAPFYTLLPKVAGGFGKRTLLDGASHPPVVSPLHDEFRGWLGDDLVTSFPCFLVSERLEQSLAAAGLTGLGFAQAEVTLDVQFHEHWPEEAASLSRFAWLRPTGSPGVDDVALDARTDLVVSQRALDAMRTHHLPHAEVESFRVAQ